MWHLPAPGGESKALLSFAESPEHVAICVSMMACGQSHCPGSEEVRADRGWLRHCVVRLSLKHERPCWGSMPAPHTCARPPAPLSSPCCQVCVFRSLKTKIVGPKHRATNLSTRWKVQTLCRERASTPRNCRKPRLEGELAGGK